MDSFVPEQRKPKKPDEELVSYMKSLIVPLQQSQEDISADTGGEDDSSSLLVQNLHRDIRKRGASLATHKRASGVIELLLKRSTPSQLVRFTARASPYVSFLARHRYGSHVLEELLGGLSAALPAAADCLGEREALAGRKDAAIFGGAVEGVLPGDAGQSGQAAGGGGAGAAFGRDSTGAEEEADSGDESDDEEKDMAGAVMMQGLEGSLLGISAVAEAELRQWMFERGASHVVRVLAAALAGDGTNAGQAGGATTGTRRASAASGTRDAERGEWCLRRSLVFALGRLLEALGKASPRDALLVAEEPAASAAAQALLAAGARCVKRLRAAAAAAGRRGKGKGKGKGGGEKEDGLSGAGLDGVLAALEPDATGAAAGSVDAEPTASGVAGAGECEELANALRAALQRACDAMLGVARASGEMDDEAETAETESGGTVAVEAGVTSRLQSQPGAHAAVEALAAVATSRAGSALAEAALESMPTGGMRQLLQRVLLAPLPHPAPVRLAASIRTLPPADAHTVALLPTGLPLPPGPSSAASSPLREAPTALLALAAHPLANFASQRAVERAAEAGMSLQAAWALLPHTAALIAARREGVVAAVVGAASKGGSLELQRATVGALQRAAALGRCRSGARGLVAWLLDVDGARGRAAEEAREAAGGGGGGDEEQDSDDEEGGAVEEVGLTAGAKEAKYTGRESEASGKGNRLAGRADRPVQLSRAGARIVGAALGLQPAAARPVLESVLALRPEALVVAAHDPAGARGVLEPLAALGPESAWARQRVVRSLRGRWADVADHPRGSRVARRLATSCDARSLEVIAVDLEAQERRIRGSRWARGLVGLCRLDHLREDKAGWRRAIESARTAREAASGAGGGAAGRRAALAGLLAKGKGSGKDTTSSVERLSSNERPSKSGGSQQASSSSSSAPDTSLLGYFGGTARLARPQPPLEAEQEDRAPSGTSAALAGGKRPREEAEQMDEVAEVGGGIDGGSEGVEQGGQAPAAAGAADAPPKKRRRGKRGGKAKQKAVGDT